MFTSFCCCTSNFCLCQYVGKKLWESNPALHSCTIVLLRRSHSLHSYVIWSAYPGSRTPIHLTWKVYVNPILAHCPDFNFIKHVDRSNYAHLHRLIRPCKQDSNLRFRLQLAYAGADVLPSRQLLLQVLYQFYYKSTQCFYCQCLFGLSANSRFLEPTLIGH